MALTSNLVVLHIADGLRRVEDARDVYYLEAVAGETSVRLRGRGSWWTSGGWV